MILKKYIPFHLCIALILGILTGFYYDLHVKLILSILIISFGFHIITFFLSENRLKPSALFPISSFLVFYFIGISIISFHNGKSKTEHYLYSLDSKNQPIILKIKTVLKANTYYDKYEAFVYQIGNRKASGKILLNVKKTSLKDKFNVDELILVKSDILKIEKPRNPNLFNYKKYLEKSGIYKQITTASNNILLLNSGVTTLKGMAHKLRLKIINSLEKNAFSYDELSIIKSLLLGERRGVSKELIENYSKAGAIHILAISGLHVGIILWFIHLVFKPLEFLKNGKNIKLIIAITLLWIFAFIAGLSASVVRAVTMFTAVAISLMGNRRKNIYHSLVFSMFFLLLIHPFYLFDVGFQMSYLAVFFIVWLQPLLVKLWSPKLRPVNYIWKLFTVSLAAQIGVLPLSLYYFHQFPALFFITNIVVIPFLGFILGLGILVITLSLINGLPQFMVKAYEGIIYLMNHFIKSIAKQESFLFENISFSIVLLISSYLVVITLGELLKYKSYKVLKIFFLSILFLQCVFIYEKRNASLVNEITIYNTNRSSLIGNRVGQNVSFYTSDTLSKDNSIIKSYNQKNKVNMVNILNGISPSLLLKKDILIIDSLGIYKIPKLKPKKILLTQSPKINLDRLIQNLNPEIVVADNSNYRSYVDLWMKTCLKNNISFHYTNKEGAFTLHN